ncbi:MAG TPA: threonine--tRNA ligase [Bacillota bacterium]|nr:threonine--tRNA ligase [Bacillota bacterium]HSX36546.1 threonine--tRNA ligase [Patescibacteria group bacterium]
MGNTEGNNHVVGIRHSLAHLLAATVIEMYPGAKNAIGPAIENGFYQDFEMPEPISDEDLPKIEARMREVLKTWGTFVRREVSPEEARQQFSWNQYKLELIDEFSKDAKQLTFYTSGAFTDLCRGGHIDDAKEIDPRSFKLTRVGGVYWRGDEKRQQLQRIYGIAFETQAQLKEYVAMLEEAKKRDHRKLGQELDLFVFSDLIGAGLPLFTPRGTVLRRKLDAFVQEMRDEYDYQEVTIPHITKKDAYIASGHWKKFEEELFRITTREGHEFAMKPMNCPHHTQLYAARSRSYKELPIRYRETTTCYRDEQSGELSGLSRLRAFSQDDAHVFCRTGHVEEEALKIWDIIDRFYGTFGFELKVRFSTHDPANMSAYSGSEEKWLNTEQQLLSIIKQKVGDNYIDGVGEAAFYGPKIDFMAKDAIGREHQVATIQLDFNQPEGFDLTCINEGGDQERILMIHAAIMGSIDRFLSVYIEHVAGKFPVWLAPEQIRIATLNQDDEIVHFAKDIAAKAKSLGLRATVDADNESVGKKIRNAELMKVPYMVVIGGKELETGELMPRIRQDMEVNAEAHTAHTVDELLKTIVHESKSRVNKTSL